MNRLPRSLVAFAVLSLTLPLAAFSSSPHGGGGKAKSYEVTPAMLVLGKAVYEKNCAACHATGVAGAPKFGDRAAWKEHIAGGLEHMAEIAIRGEGAMPPRGGNSELTDAEIRAAVAYIAEHSR